MPTSASVLVSLVAMVAAPASPPHLVNSLGMELARIPAGSFRMGSQPGELGRRGNEGPSRLVHITQPFHMGVHEVTVGQFAAFVADTGYRTEAEHDVDGGFGIDFETGRVEQDPDCHWNAPGFPGHRQTDRHPVVLVSWLDAEAFCRWLSSREGVEYRLPTEAEWEYACRGGTTTPYWSGDDESSLVGAANLADRSLAARMPTREAPAAFDDGHAFTAPVGSFAPNAFGLHDMHGNVWEWCLDWHADRSYADAASVDPLGPSAGSFRAIRGGGWFNGPLRNRAAQRIYFAPTFRYCLLSGFRVVCTGAPAPAADTPITDVVDLSSGSMPDPRASG